LDHLDDERAKETIRVLDEMMKTDKENSDCFVGSGIAFGRYKNTAAYSSVGIELEVNDHSSIILKRAWITADVGEIIDPDGVTQQLEGGLIQAASWTLYESVAYDENGIISKDWENYPIMRFDNIPNIKTVLINQPTQPFLGCGETVAGPTAAAISNALFNAIRIRLRRMPFTPDAIQKKLLSD
jgi:CO/xanthine dehydrogenase Mo-binding subunit